MKLNHTRAAHLALGTLSIAILNLLAPHAVQAQSILDQSSPGAVIQSIQQPEALPGQSTNTVQKNEKPSVENQTIRTDLETNDPALSTKFKVSNITLTGASPIGTVGIENLITQYENKDQSLLDLQELTRKLTKVYHNAGYLTTRVVLPPQSIDNGKVTLSIVQGNAGNIIIEEGVHFKRRAIAPRISLQSGEPLNVDILEDDIRRINDNPDVKVNAILRPGSETGQSDVVLKVTDKQPIHLTPFVDNLGRRLIGRERIGVTLTHNNLLGLGDQLLSSVSFSSNSFGTVHQYQAPIGSHGTTAGVNFAYSSLKLGRELKALDIGGTATSFSPFVSQEFYGSDKWRIAGDITLDLRDLKTDVGDIGLFKDRVRDLRAGINVQEFDSQGNTFIRNEITLGLDMLGATNGDEPYLSRAGADSKFFRYMGTAVRNQKLPWNTFGIFRATGQLTPDRLVSSEQLQVGGAFSVRGYREGILIGDQGLILSGEWRLPVFFVNKDAELPFSNYRIRDNIQLVTFLDAGLSNNNDVISGEYRNEVAIGTGVGVRFKITKFLVGRVDLGVPLAHQDRANPVLHFGLQSALF